MAKDVSARIPVTPDTAQTLNKMKQGYESYDSLIRRLVLHAQNTNIKPSWDLSEADQQYINGGEQIKKEEVTNNASKS